jgi:hypothetical protein
VKEKTTEEKKSDKKRGWFARLLERIAKENQELGGQACIA